MGTRPDCLRSAGPNQLEPSSAPSAGAGDYILQLHKNGSDNRLVVALIFIRLSQTGPPLALD
jgi:hypothetical protein